MINKRQGPDPRSRLKDRFTTRGRCAARCCTAAAAALLAGCAHEAQLPVSAGMGVDPELPPPPGSRLPTVNVAEATGWPTGEQPVTAPDLSVTLYADGLDHPRWLYVLPNGDVLVAESNAPPSDREPDGIRGWLMQRLLSKAGAGAPSADRITLLRDTNGDGIADTRNVLLDGLTSPFGMVLVKDYLYVANTDELRRFRYRPNRLSLDGPGETVVELPAGPINYHWTKNVVVSPDGSRLYVAVGSNSNIGENGMDAEEQRAAILEVDPAAGHSRVFASGLRNPVGLAYEPLSGVLWTTVNERDGLGSDLVPDFMTSVCEACFYGWPYSYYGQNVDERVQPQRPDLVGKAIAPDYALGPHTASLGLAFYTTGRLPERYAGGAFVAQHGSWNRKPSSGFKVIFVPFINGRPVGKPETILAGFLGPKGKARGRPVGLAVSAAGDLLVADDVGNRIWRVTANSAAN